MWKRYPLEPLTQGKNARNARLLGGLILLSIAGPLLPAAQAAVELASLFQDHAVLQRDRAVPIWGWAEPGEKVRVSFAGQTRNAVADARGHWRVELDPMPASAEPAVLTASGRTEVHVSDLLVGEVWVCSGQSNMEYPVDPQPIPPDRLHLDRQKEETAAAQYPLIRNFKVAWAASDRPAEKVRGRWVVCSPAAMANFTAVGYFFARDLYQRLGVPFGIIDSSWGGTQIESWLSAGALASDPGFRVVGERWTAAMAAYPARLAESKAYAAEWKRLSAAAKAEGKDAYDAFLKSHRKPKTPGMAPGSQWMPSSLFNGMISPLMPYAIRGVLWYQGESNVSRASEYGPLFIAMIRQWRRDWGEGDFPFYFVQLASYRPKRMVAPDWAFLREAQAKALALPATGMAVAIDNPDPKNLHPGNKQDLGFRLALIAQTHVYGLGGEWSGPVYLDFVRQGRALCLKFSHAAGLELRGSPPAGFEVAGEDRIFRPAEAQIEYGTLVLSAPAVPNPVAARYDWADDPSPSLFNGVGLPASPFRTDSW